MWGEFGEPGTQHPERGQRLAARFALAHTPSLQEIVRWESVTRDLYACGYRLSAAALLAARRCFRGVGAGGRADPHIALCTLLPARVLQLACPT